ncbi:hypothetical protein H8A95_37750 [Bradyrhizobium sp. Pear76]|uniref:hypothetical protein n=1 Tax=Bradyrhizobium oropedii TaxID=1571201 RepID=UPI001E4FC547|nr:hypothetical protein [Bradyrhizobium oropedii]MCC8967905.1 hypothetical protein [Bradyrhizobium oropedii]
MPTWLTIALLISTSLPLFAAGRVIYRVGYWDGHEKGLEDAHRLYTGIRKPDEAPRPAMKLPAGRP